MGGRGYKCWRENKSSMIYLGNKCTFYLSKTSASRWLQLWHIAHIKNFTKSAKKILKVLVIQKNSQSDDLYQENALFSLDNRSGMKCVFVWRGGVKPVNRIPSVLLSSIGSPTAIQSVSIIFSLLYSFQITQLITNTDKKKNLTHKSQYCVI
jgi:hypothetical protein